MARLSTGQTYGDTNRSTAAQLLGGIPVDASMGALAQSSIGTPSLQPKAAPVETFQRVGAPTLGGAPQFFAPPKLPDPGQDLANLARSLGGFSTTLQSFGDTFLANKQEQEKKKEASSAAFVGQTAKYGPARGMADLAANLEKAATLGDAQAAKHLQYVREQQNSSYGRYFLERSIEQNAISSAALSLSDKLAATSTIKVDGKDVDFNSLSSTDPRYLARRDELLFGGAQMTPQGYAKNQQLILQATLQADEAQRKRYNEAQVPKYVGQVSVETQTSAREYVALHKKGLTEQAYQAGTASIQLGYDKIKSLPITQEQQRDLMNKYPEKWATEVVLAVKQAGGTVEDMRTMLKPLRSVMTGPIEERTKKDGKPNESLLLINTLGGEAFFDQVVSKANASQIQDNTQRAQMAGITQQQAFDTRLQAALPEGRRSDPGAIKGFFKTERERAAMEPDGILRAAMFSQLDASERQLTETYVKPVQEQQALALARELDNTRDNEAARNALTAKVQTLLQGNQITSATAVSIQTTLSAQGSKQVQSYRKEINKRVDDILKNYEAYVTSPGSYGRETINGFEYQTMYNARSMAARKLEEAVDQAIKEGKDPTEAMNKVQLNNNFGLRKREEVGGAQTPRYNDTTQLIQKNTGNWSRNTISPREANQLRSDAKVRPLMEAGSWDRDVTSLLNGAPSQNFRTLLKTLTTGTGGQKPSEVIFNQFKLLGIDVPENERQKIQALDGQKISAAPARRRQSPQQNQALAGVQIVGRALGNALVPAAQAQTAPPPVGMAMFYASPTAPPKPVAAKQGATPQARVDGYLKRLSYIETRLRNIPNSEGSPARGYFQAFPAFSSEAISASGGVDPRDPDFNKASKATAAWIRTYNKRAWAAIRAGRYDEADRLLRNTWPSLPGGDQAQASAVQKTARKYLR